METRWEEKRKQQRSYLSEVLDIAHGTGRRVSAICSLTYADLRLNEGPHGAIRWPADTDKMGRESVVPIGPLVRSALDRALRDRPGIGAHPLFPSPDDRTKPIRYELASDWLRDAEKLAKVEKQDGSLWHAYRRGWATARKDGLYPVRRTLDLSCPIRTGGGKRWQRDGGLAESSSRRQCGWYGSGESRWPRSPGISISM